MSSMLKVGFVGAGRANFGPSRPWCHASKVEKYIRDVTVIGIVDIDTTKAESVLQTRRSSEEFGHLYGNCEVLADYMQLIALRPDVVIIGVPPGVRGSFTDGRDMELQFVMAGIHILVEKPLSTSSPEHFQEYARAVTTEAEKRNVMVSVGYVFRYHPAIEKMNEMIKQHGGKVMAFNVRFYIAHADAVNKSRFNAQLFGGPLCEEATHFFDLARYLTESEIDHSSIQCLTVKDTDRNGAGKLANLPSGTEDGIPFEKRIPRVTVAQWRFKDAGVGTLMLSLALPGCRLETYMDVQLDGLSFSISRPYAELRVRSQIDEDPDAAVISSYDTTAEADMYRKQLQAFFEAVRTNNPTLIRSHYSDSAKTFEFTKVVSEAGERN
ncbi:uncharacterized protein LOC141902889 [Tubulanus polymorphus]|uniref:uncharacterized protein LOC141902889 n=1 Tax=Tubulanus polymorphus TaxID=672921 RepID=UPI003DA392A3